jgi:F-type H+-transporting ATPase subunit delta
MRVTEKARRLARRLFIRCLIDGRPDAARVRLVTEHLAASRQRTGLAVFAAFRRLVRSDRERHTAVVESALMLPDDARGEIRSALARLYGADLDVGFRENAELIAGVHIKVGGDVYDGSVRGRLDAIERRL